MKNIPATQARMDSCSLKKHAQIRRCFVFSPSQHEFGVLGHVLLHEVLQQTLHDFSEILQFVVKSHGQETGHVSSVPLREALLRLQSVDELEEKQRI